MQYCLKIGATSFLYEVAGGDPPSALATNPPTKTVEANPKNSSCRVMLLIVTYRLLEGSALRQLLNGRRRVLSLLKSLILIFSVILAKLSVPYERENRQADEYRDGDWIIHPAKHDDDIRNEVNRGDAVGNPHQKLDNSLPRHRGGAWSNFAHRNLSNVRTTICVVGDR